MEHNKRIFISYAHKDGRDLAVQLKESLQGFYDVWLDTSEIGGGQAWGEEIERAIDEHDILLALLSPASLHSPICRAEQLRAIRRKKHVIPLLVYKDTDRPIWFEEIQYKDFSDANSYAEKLNLLLNDLGNKEYIPLPSKIIPHEFHIYNNSQPLTAFFISRQEEYKELKKALLKEDAVRKMTLVNLYGMPGVGKSSLAGAICNDDNEFLQDAFPDGIFWIEFSNEESDILAKLRWIGTKLGADERDFLNLDTAIAAFKDIIRHKYALIVLDDVWEQNQEIVKHFTGESRYSRWLITTREDFLRRDGANCIPLKEMTDGEAIELLKNITKVDDNQYSKSLKK